MVLPRRTSLAMLFALPLGACDACNHSSSSGLAVPPTASTEAPSAPSATAVVTASQAPAPAALPSACQAKGAALAIDKGLRGDAGITLTATARGVLVGYAKGEKPFVARLNGVSSEVLSIEGQDTAFGDLPAGSKRTVWRVLPLASEDTSATVAVDTLRIDADKTRHVTCGPIGHPMVVFEGKTVASAAAKPVTAPAADALASASPSLPAATSASPSLPAAATSKVAEGTPFAEKQTIECRTLGGEAPAAVASTLVVTEEGAISELSWIKPGGDATALTTRTTKLKPKEQANERYAFTQLGYTPGTPRELFTARFNGNAVLVPVEKGSAALRSDFVWFGAPSNAPVAVGLPESALLFNTVVGKNDVWASYAHYEEAKRTKPDFGKLGKAKTLPISIANEHGFVSALMLENDVLLAVTEVENGRKKTVIHRLRLDEKDTLTEVGTLALGDADETISEARMAPLPNGDVVVAYLSLTTSGGYMAKALTFDCSAVGEPTP